jgi:hypothetical protein
MAIPQRKNANEHAQSRRAKLLSRGFRRPAIIGINEKRVKSEDKVPKKMKTHGAAVEIEYLGLVSLEVSISHGNKYHASGPVIELVLS